MRRTGLGNLWSGGEDMAEREHKKSLKDRAQELVQGVVDAVESLFPAPQQLIPIAARPAPRPNPRRRR
jgi:hypothetical protein